MKYNPYKQPRSAPAKDHSHKGKGSRGTWILAGLLVLLCFYPGQASTVSFNDMTLQGLQKIQVYNSTGAYVTEINSTTSGYSLDPNQSYIFVILPSVTNYLEDPSDLFARILDFLRNNAIEIVIGCLIMIVIFRR